MITNKKGYYLTLRHISVHFATWDPPKISLLNQLSWVILTVFVTITDHERPLTAMMMMTVCSV